MADDQKELQLLPIPYTTASYSRASPWPSDLITFRSDDVVQYPPESTSLDLQLSISLRPITPPAAVETWQRRPAEQFPISGVEKGYAERLMEMTRREMELAQSELSRARHMWEGAREEVERVEKMKERATRQMGSCMEVTCQACSQKFRR